MMNNNIETKSEIRARIQELQTILLMIGVGSGQPVASYQDSQKLHDLRESIMIRLEELEKKLESSEEDIAASVLRSHKAVCKAKRMDEKAAYGNEPLLFYSMCIAGESGELLNAIVHASRNGFNKQKIHDSICSELPDIVIYSYVLAHVLDIDLSKLVNEKVEVVIGRAESGYYGGPLSPGTPGALPE